MKRNLLKQIFLLLLVTVLITFLPQTSYAKTKKKLWVVDEITMTKGNKAHIGCYGLSIPSLTDKVSSLKSSNTKIATINRWGVVKAKKTGTVVITKYKKQKNGKKKAVRKCKIVIKKEIPIEEKFVYKVETDKNGQPCITNLSYVGYDAIVTVPSSINGIPVNSITTRLFWTAIDSKEPTMHLRLLEEQIEGVYIEDGITHIGSHAFSAMPNLEEIQLPSTITSIDPYAFCSSGLKKINIDVLYHLDSIPVGCFSMCGNLAVPLDIPGNIKSIGDDAFSMTSIPSVTLNEGLTTIGKFAFQHTNISKITIPKTVTSIGYGAFQYNNLDDITILPTNITIGEKAFSNLQGNSKHSNVTRPIFND